MKHLVFFEGVSKSGKTTVCRALADWRRDLFSYYDRGPWSRCMLGLYYGQGKNPGGARAVALRAAPASIVVYLHRDLDALARLNGGDPESARQTLLAQQRCYEEAFAMVAPAHLVRVHNRSGLSPEDLARDVKARLLNLQITIDNLQRTEIPL